MIQSNLFFIVLTVGVGAGLGLQEPSGSKKDAPAAKAPAPALPADLFLVKQPEGVKAVEEIKSSVKAGDKVLVRGRIGGSTAPFVEGRAVFTLMGAGLKACSDNPEDKCKTPWDYCCETPEVIVKHLVTIQVVDAAGAPLRAGLKGANGLKELSEVIVQGTVKEARDKIMIINATGLFIARP